MIETGYKEVVNELWYIYAPETQVIKRLQKTRGYSLEKIDLIMKNQLSEELFYNGCDFVIDNSQTLEYSYEQINKRLEDFTWQS